MASQGLKEAQGAFPQKKNQKVFHDFLNNQILRAYRLYRVSEYRFCLHFRSVQTMAKRVGSIRGDVRDYRLVLARVVWTGFWRATLAAPDCIGICRLRWHNTAIEHELIGDQIQVESSQFQGREMPRDATWLMMRRVDTLDRKTVEQIWRDATLGPDQSVVMLLFESSNLGNWMAGMANRNAFVAIEKVDIIGGGMVSLREGPGLPTPTLETKWSRLAKAIDQPMVHRMKESTITIVGVGGLGVPMAFKMAELGVGRIRLIDGDVLEDHNRTRMAPLDASFIGQPKVRGAISALERYRPELQLSGLDRQVHTAAGIQFLSERSDLLITCVDNDLPRLVVAEVARRSLMMHLDIGTRVSRDGQALTMAADARLLVPTSGCVSCIGGVEMTEDMEREKRFPERYLPETLAARWDQERDGSLPTINGVIVGAAAQLWLRFLAGQLKGSHWLRMLESADGQWQVDSGAVAGDSGCPICH